MLDATRTSMWVCLVAVMRTSVTILLEELSLREERSHVRLLGSCRRLMVVPSWLRPHFCLLQWFRVSGLRCQGYDLVAEVEPFASNSHD